MQDWQDALLVYSTESGKIKNSPKEETRSVSSDGIVRIHRETKGRKGKGVSLIKGLDLAPDELKKLGTELKKKCGCGGAVKDGIGPDPDTPYVRVKIVADANADGKVEFRSDFYLIKPKDISRGNGTLFYEVSNRGGKGIYELYHH